MGRGNGGNPVVDKKSIRIIRYFPAGTGSRTVRAHEPGTLHKYTTTNTFIIMASPIGKGEEFYKKLVMFELSSDEEGEYQYRDVRRTRQVLHITVWLS